MAGITINAHTETIQTITGDLVIQTPANYGMRYDTVAWNDFMIGSELTRIGTVAPTDETGFRGDVNMYSRNFVHTQADEVQFKLQLPHDWKEGSTIHPHVHFSPWVAGGTNNSVKFILSYYWADIDEQFPASPATTTMTKTWTGDKQWYHLIADADTDITASGQTFSSMLVCRLYRDNTVTNNLAGKIAFLEFDIHYQIDIIGSRQEYVK